jgi:hypothetical protein
MGIANHTAVSWNKFKNEKRTGKMKKDLSSMPPWLTAAAAEYGIELEALIKQSAPPAEADDPQFLSLKDTARLAGVSKFTVARWVKNGALPMIKLSSSRQGSVLIEKTDIINLMHKLKNHTWKELKKCKS